MSRDGSEYVIKANRLPAGENASTFDGHEHGASVSFFLSRNVPGSGPDLHRHPYEEMFIIEEGNVRFTVGKEKVEAAGGDIVVVPAGTPHKFVNIGNERLRQISIHPVPRMDTEWLE
jgi:mannose-6-phosphate isomerase-like protein (cupin superfamily)